jgi:hypothetical protein
MYMYTNTRNYKQRAKLLPGAISTIQPCTYLEILIIYNIVYNTDQAIKLLAYQKDPKSV